MSGNIIVFDIIASERPSEIRADTPINLSHISSSHILNVLFYSIVVAVALLSSLFQWAGISLMLRNFQ